MSVDLQKVAYKVFSVLTEIPMTRDDDRLLLVELWSKESSAKDIAGLFNELLGGEISHPESVSRIRRKIQEKHESLRGKKYDSRHGMEANVCSQLSFFDRW